MDAGDKRMQIDAVVQLYEQLKPDMLVLVDPAFSEDDLRMRHVPPSPDWFILRDPNACCAVLMIEGLDARLLDGAFPGYVRPRPPPSPPRVAVVVVDEDDNVPDAVAAFVAHGIIPLEQRNDLSPDDLAAIKDALAANEREHGGRFVGDEQLRRGGGGGAFINPEVFGSPLRGDGVTYGIDVGDDDDEDGDDVMELEGGYLAQLHGLARMANIPPPRRQQQQQQQSPRVSRLPATITVINNVLDAGAGGGVGGVGEAGEGAARRVFAEQRRRDDVLRRNAGPRANMAPVNGVAARRGNIGSIARRRIADNANRVQISRAIGKPESRKLLAARKEDPGIEPMATTADDNTCMICMSTHVTTMLLPCLHMMYCHKCVVEWQKASDKCPSCNAKIDSVVQPRTIFNPQEEYTRRSKDPRHLAQVADKMQADVDNLRLRAKTLAEAGPVATMQEPVTVAVAIPHPPLLGPQQQQQHQPPPPSVIPAPPSPTLPVLPSRRARAPAMMEEEDDDEEDDLGSFIEEDDEDDEEGALDDDDEEMEEEVDFMDNSYHHPLCVCELCEDADSSSSSVVEIVAPPPPSTRRKRAAPSKKKAAAKRKTTAATTKKKKPVKKKKSSSMPSAMARKKTPVAAVVVKRQRKGE